MNSGVRLLQRNYGYWRSFQSVTKRFMAYEGDGKTSVTILNQEMDTGLMINSFSQMGFRLNNGMTVIGPMAIFARSVLSWNVGTLSDINEETLSLFCALEPKVDILVLGIGDQKADVKFYSDLLKITRKYKMNLEILSTEQACATFNFLNAEGRSVAGGFIPPEKVVVSDNDLLESKIRYQKLYIDE